MFLVFVDPGNLHELGISPLDKEDSQKFKIKTE